MWSSDMTLHRVESMGLPSLLCRSLETVVTVGTWATPLIPPTGFNLRVTLRANTYFLLTWYVRRLYGIYDPNMGIYIHDLQNEYVFYFFFVIHFLLYCLYFLFLYHVHKNVTELIFFQKVIHLSWVIQFYTNVLDWIEYNIPHLLLRMDQRQVEELHNFVLENRDYGGRRWRPQG